MTDLIGDEAIDSVGFAWEELPQYSGTRVINFPPELRIIRDFLETSFWQSLVRFIAAGVLEQHMRGRDYNGFMFPGDLDPGDEPFEGVMLWDPIDTVYLSAGAFDRLMSRFFDTVIDGVTRYQKPEVNEAWWPEFVAVARQIRMRAHGR